MRKLLTNWKFVFGLGLLVVLAATTIETLRGRATNFYAYYDATNMFWAGINPYTLEYVEAHSIWFLYTPVFTTIYAPIFLLLLILQSTFCFQYNMVVCYIFLFAFILM